MTLGYQASSIALFLHLEFFYYLVGNKTITYLNLIPFFTNRILMSFNLISWKLGLAENAVGWQLT